MKALPRPSAAVNALLALLIVGSGFWGWTLLRDPSSDTRASATGLRTVTAAQGTVTRTVSAAGAVQSASTATAAFGTSGTVTGINVKVGDTVPAGALLARMDDTGAKRDLAMAQASLNAAGNALRRAESTGVDTSIAVDAVAGAELAVDKAEAAVAGTRLTAPMAGTVVAINGSLGGWSQSSAEGGFIDLADLRRLQVTAAFSEAEAAELSEGQTATVTWKALRGAEATGRVVAVDPTAKTGKSGVTYGVTIDLPKPPKDAKPGQTVSVSVVTGTADNTVMVHPAAVTTTGDRHSVTVLAGNGRQEARPVEVGLEGDGAYQITSGLNAGERVVVPATAAARQE